MPSNFSSGGNVIGPSSAVNNDSAVFNGTTGRIIKDGGAGALGGSGTGSDNAIARWDGTTAIQSSLWTIADDGTLSGVNTGVSGNSFIYAGFANIGQNIDMTTGTTTGARVVNRGIVAGSTFQYGDAYFLTTSSGSGLRLGAWREFLKSTDGTDTMVGYYSHLINNHDGANFGTVPTLLQSAHFVAKNDGIDIGQEAIPFFLGINSTNVACVQIDSASNMILQGGINCASVTAGGAITSQGAVLEGITAATGFSAAGVGTDDSGTEQLLWSTSVLAFGLDGNTVEFNFSGTFGSGAGTRAIRVNFQDDIFSLSGITLTSNSWSLKITVVVTSDGFGTTTAVFHTANSSGVSTTYVQNGFHTIGDETDIQFYATGAGVGSQTDDVLLETAVVKQGHFHN